MSGENTDQTQDGTGQEAANEPSPGTPEYNEAMIQKAREARGEEAAEGTEGSQETGQETGQDPAPDVPDKFKNEDGSVNIEALAKSYRELETKVSSGSDSEQQQALEQTDQDTQSMAEKAGLDFEQLKQKVQTNGEIDAADYEAFEKIGVPKNLVQEVIQFRQQQAEQMRTQAVEYIGGEQETTDLMQWAGENLTQEEIDTYNQMLNGQNWKHAVDRLKSLRGLSSKTANEPQLQQPGTTATSSDGFTNRDEMRAAMQDERYFKNTPEGAKYREEVMRKLANSPTEVRKASH